MTPRLLRCVLRLYPRSFRARFGAQFLRTAEELIRRAPAASRRRVTVRVIGDACVGLVQARLGTSDERWRPLRNFGWDLRQAIRELLWRPRLTVTCVAVLAVGMGINTAVFSVANAALLRPIDYVEPDRLVLVWSDWRAADFPEAPLSPLQLSTLAAANDVFEEVGGLWATNATLTGGELPEQVSVGRVTPSFFTTLGITPARGRLLRVEDAVDPAAPAAAGGVLVGDGFWRTALGADPEVIGASLRLDGVDHEIVGVLPPGFQLFFPPGKGVPTSLDIYTAFPPLEFLNPDNFYLRAIGRLRDGITRAAASQALEAPAADLRRARVDLAESDAVFKLLGLQQEWSRDLQPALIAIQAGAGLLLLLALTNVTSLVIAGAVDRLPALAVRASLGADRRRLARQLVLEAVVISGTAIGVGFAIGSGALSTLWQSRPESLQRLADVGADLRVALYSVAVMLLAVSAVAAGPVVLLRRSGLRGFLVSRGRVGVGGTGRIVRRAAAVVQAASAFALLVACLLLARSVANLENTATGFVGADRMVFSVALPYRALPEDAGRIAAVREIGERIAELPGVLAVAASSHAPLGGWVNWAGAVLPMDNPDDPTQQGIVDHRAVTPGYLATLGARLVEGREFIEADDLDSAVVAVVDAPLARRLTGGGSPIDRTVEVSVYRDFEFHRVPARIVGVVEPIRDRGPQQPSAGQVFVPFAQSPRWEISFVVHAERVETLVDPVRRLVPSVNGDLAAARVRLLADDQALALQPSRFAWMLSMIVAVSAAALAASGIYAVLALEIRGRAHEIGVRLALGARAGEVFHMVLRSGFRLGVLGVVLGTPLALGFTTLLRSSLHGLAPMEWGAYVPAALVGVALGCLAAAVPARRATHTDPLTALRAGGE